MDPHNVIGRQIADIESPRAEVVPSGPTMVLDAAARERAFDYVWQTINSRYYDPQLNGVDWNAIGMRYRPLAHAAANDEAFWDVLDRMTGELQDAHTRVESPRRAALRKRDESISMGFSFVPLAGKLAVLGRFFPAKTELGRVLTRTGRPISLFFGTVEVIKLKTEVDGNSNAYRGPVVVLLNAMSGSASELFAATLQATGRAAVLGEPSCGCLLGFLGYARIPGGGELAYSEVGFVMPNGKRIEGEGVVPDHLVPVTLADLRVSRDRALEEAQNVLRSLPPWTR